MTERSKGAIALTGRVLLSAIFLYSGATKIFNWSGTTGFMAAKGMPAVDFFLAGAIALKLGGGLLLISGYRARWGALGLLVFLIAVTLIFHNFWAIEDSQEAFRQKMSFLMNLGLMGGLLMVIAHGPGPLSIEAKRKR